MKTIKKFMLLSFVALSIASCSTVKATPPSREQYQFIAAYIKNFSWWMRPYFKKIADKSKDWEWSKIMRELRILAKQGK